MCRLKGVVEAPKFIGLSHWVAVLVLTAMLMGCGGPSRRITTQTDIQEALPDKYVPPRATIQTDSSVALSTKSILPARPDQRRVIIDAAYAMRGRPYRWGGQSPQRGFDCSGLVYFTHHEAGISVPRVSRNQLSQSAKVAVNRIQPGDLLFFKTGSSVSHVGIYIGKRNFIHAPSQGKRVSIGSLANGYWRRRFYAAGHFYSQ